MLIWFDMLTPKHVLFLHPLIVRLQKKGHFVFMTTRNYREALGMIAIRKITPVWVYGRHGGGDKHDKLIESSKRVLLLADIIRKIKPDICVSCASPEAARVSFGLGIRHVVFTNAVHLEKIMRLVIPFTDTLITPKHVASGFLKYGIDKKKIIPYDGFDEMVIVKDRPTKYRPPVFKKPIILVRNSEYKASIKLRKFNAIDMIKKVATAFPQYQVVVMPRYRDEIMPLKEKLGSLAHVLTKPSDSGVLLSMTHVFIGSGGTMTTEAVLRGVNTISVNSSPNPDEAYLVRKKMLVRAETVPKIIDTIRHSRFYKPVIKCDNPHDLFNLKFNY